MATVLKPSRECRTPSERQYLVATRSLLAIAGSLFALLGIVVAVAGALATNGSSFYVLAGFGLIASGALLAKRHPAGAWTYMAVFAGTVSWLLHEAHPGGSSLAYRLIGPVILIVMISLLMPILGRWSRVRTVGVCAALIIATVTYGIFANDSADPADQPSGAHSQFSH